MRITGLAVLGMAMGLAACAGAPDEGPPPLMVMPVAVEGDPAAAGEPVKARLDPTEVICRTLPPPTGSRISKGGQICQTRAEWTQQEERSRAATRDMQEFGAVSRDKSD